MLHATISISRGSDTADGAGSMPEFPSGTVTFLFTDIEGSTRLERNREERAEVVDSHGAVRDDPRR
jgi:class 3 adenylate cyclase